MNSDKLNISPPKEKVAASTQNQALCAIIFLYKHVLKIKIGDLGEIVWAKKPKHLPEVFTRAEVQAIIDQLTGIKWIMVNLLYGAGSMSFHQKNYQQTREQGLYEDIM